MSTSKFPMFAQLVTASFQERVQNAQVFVVDLEGDAIYAQYLAAFPEGTNPIFKKTTEHDCSCCKHFIRRAGGVVTIDGGLQTVWDMAADSAPSPYREVATQLRDMVRAAGVRDVYVVGQNEARFGAAQTRSLDKETQRAVTWNHFCTGDIQRRLRVDAPDELRGIVRTTVQVFARGLAELSPEAVNTVLSLVDANALYRGEEHRPALAHFQKMQREFLTTADARAGSLFVWANAGSSAARFRNTVIGTLVQDLSEGQDIERAVRSIDATEVQALELLVGSRRAFERGTKFQRDDTVGIGL